MHPFDIYVLRSYYKATGWNEDNLFSNLTRSSDAVIDFSVPKGLQFTVSKSPNPLFKTTYSMAAMPALKGSIGYIFTSCDLGIRSSESVRFKDMLDRFKVYDQPKRPEGKEEEWLAGERVDARDYLLYGRYHLPSGQLDALYSTRLSPTLQASISAISAMSPITVEDEETGSVRQVDPSNLLVKLQHDVGKWFTEFSYTADDGMLGAQVVYNFGRLASSSSSSTDDGNGIPSGSNSTSPGSRQGVKRVDEEDAVEGGLRGRISVGAEVYGSLNEFNGGLSTGIRFSTMPDATPPSAQIPPPSPFAPEPSTSALNRSYSQPPTTITALFSPIPGHIQTAYTARVSRDIAIASRFGFNVYSYDSDWSMGVEWWLRRAPPVQQEGEAKPSFPSPLGEVHGVVKAKASSDKSVSLMWEGRIRQLLVSLGGRYKPPNYFYKPVNRSSPFKAGIEVTYFSSE